MTNHSFLRGQMHPRCALALALAGCSSGVFAQTPLLSNGHADPATPRLATGSLTLSGVAAPGGAAWSEAPLAGSEANAVGGFSSSAVEAPGAGAYRFSDDFTVPNTVAGWEINRVALFAYQTGWAGQSSPFSAVSVRIWSGRPGDAGSNLLWGDPLTSRLLTSTATDIYRIFSTTATPLPQTPDTSRRIWRTEAAVGGGSGTPGTGLVLAPGVYWIDWQYTCADANALAFSPPVTNAGARGPAGANALQLDGAGVWAPIVDSGKPAWAADIPQDLPFILIGSPATPCTADFDGVNGLTSDDIFAFLNVWFSNVGQSGPGLAADINGDELVNADDIFAFLALWFAGC